jgi:hypothetical protein
MISKRDDATWDEICNLGVVNDRSNRHQRSGVDSSQLEVDGGHSNDTCSSAPTTDARFVDVNYNNGIQQCLQNMQQVGGFE